MIRPAILILIALSCSLAPALAQNYVQGFGEHVFDTSLHDATDFSFVDAGRRHSLAVRGNGKVVGWGGKFGQANVPQIALPAVAVQAGSTTAAALLVDGSIVAWGSYPTVPTLPAGVTFVDVAAGTWSIAAIRSDGEMTAWGRTTYGQTMPPALPAGLTYIDVSGGNGWFAALRSDGQLVAWGRNNLGQAQVPSPPPGRVYVAVECGESHGLALRSDGQIDAWGYNYHGQAAVPVLPVGSTYVQMAAASTYGLAVRSDGVVVGWGLSNNGQIDVPALPAGVSVVQITAGMFHAAMLRSDGRVVSWGGDGFFERNFIEAAVAANPVAIDSAETGCAVLDDAGQIHVHGSGWGAMAALPAGMRYESFSMESGLIALRSDGAVINFNGTQSFPALPAGVSYVAVASGGPLSAALRSDGAVASLLSIGLSAPPPGLFYLEIATGSFQAGRLSNGEIETSSVLIPSLPAPPTGLDVLQIDAGASHGLSLRSDGQIDVWGTAYVAGPPAPAPALPPGVTYVEVAANWSHSVARRSDGTIVAWESDPTMPPDPKNGTVLPAGSGVPNATFNGVGGGRRSTVAIVGPTSTYVTFAQGCAGSLPSARLVPEDTPKIGHALAVRCFDLPAGVAVLAAGLSNTSSAFGPLPVSLAGLGATGCAIQISPDATAVISSSIPGGPGRHVLLIPNDQALLGATLYQQALVFDPGANAAGFVMSDAAKLVVGR